MKNFKSTFKNLFENIKVASKDRVDLILFVIFAILSVQDLAGNGIPGSLGFETFFLFWALIRLATLKRELAKKGAE